MINQFVCKEDVDLSLRTADALLSLARRCEPLMRSVRRNNPALYSQLMDMIEGAQSSCARYGRRVFVSTIWSLEHGFQFSYEATRMPVAYAFACLLRQMLPAQDPCGALA